MKKTLAAVAVLSAFATSAFAAEVTIYGRIDAGFALNNNDSTNYRGEKVLDSTDFSMDSGLMSTNRLGFKGSETINEDLEVGFVLETKLMGDTGAAFDGGFDRESLVYLKTNYGSFYAGRVGSMWSDGGATNFWASNYVAGGTGGGDYTLVGANLMVSESARVANRISYVSPTFAGFTLYGEYSFGTTNEGENTSRADRPAALGLNYANGPFGVGLVVTYRNEASVTGTGTETKVKDKEDEFTVNLGTRYNAGFADFKLAGQYFTGAQSIGWVTGSLSDALYIGKDPADADKELGVLDDYDDLTGWSIVAGADIPAWGGTWTVAAAYTDAESDDDLNKVKFGKIDFKGYQVGAMYAYPLSKQTVIKAGVGYLKTEAESDVFDAKAEYESVNAVIGILKYF